MTFSTISTRSIAASTALMISMAVSSTAFAGETNNTQVGKLKCNVEGGIGMLLGSKKKMSCVFEKKDGSVENYVGRVTKVGLDIGVTAESTIIWTVFAPSGKNDKGGLPVNTVALAPKLLLLVVLAQMPCLAQATISLSSLLASKGKTA